MADRPRFQPTPRPHHMALMLSAEELAALQALARARGMTQSAILRQALREYQASLLPPVDLGPKMMPDG